MYSHFSLDNNSHGTNTANDKKLCVEDHKNS